MVELYCQDIALAFHEKVVNSPGYLTNGAVYIFEISVVEWLAGLGKTQINIITEIIPLFRLNVNL